MASSPKVSCSRCGRDTRSKSAICAKCMGGGADEQRGRKARSSQVLGGSPIEYVDPEDSGDISGSQDYHGDSIRDDI